MLAKKYRLPIQQFYIKERSSLPTSRQFAPAVRKNSFFIVKTKKSDLPFSRFGVVVGNKVNKLATRRNFIRRNIYNWILSIGLHKKPNKDVMIIVLPNIKELDVNKIQVELSKLL